MTEKGLDSIISGLKTAGMNAFVKAPLLRDQAQLEAGLKNAQAYSANMSGNKSGAEAAGLQYTLDQRKGIPDLIASNPELADYTKRMFQTFQITGDTNAERVAKAGGEFQTQGARDAVMQGANSLPVAQAYFATSGKAPFDAVGSTGRNLNQLTGQGGILDPSLAGNYDANVKAQTGERNAAAVNSYASADQHRASTGKINLEAAQIASGESKVPAGYRRIANGNLEPIPGGPAAGGKPLPIYTTKELETQTGIADNTQRLLQTFKPEYGGHTVMGDLSNTAGRMMGDNTGQSQWWQDYALHEAQVRNKLFGASLTTGEQAAWNKTAITPRMNPDQIRENLARRAQIENKGLQRAMRTAAAGGYNRNQIEEVTGRTIPTEPPGNAVMLASPAPSGREPIPNMPASPAAAGGVKFLGFE